MKPHLAGRLFVAVALVATPLVLRAPAQDRPAGAPAPTASAATDNSGTDSVKPAITADKAPDQSQHPAATLSPGIAEILKLMDAGVSKDVIKEYIDKSAIAYNPTAADLIALKQHAVTDDITTALVKHGGEARAQTGQASTGPAAPQAPAAAPDPGAAPAYAEGNPGYGNMDPESYDYWWYYYAYPRTLAYANQRFYYNPLAPFSTPYPYNYYQPMPFQPFPPGAFARPRNSGARGNFAPMNRRGPG